MHHYSVLAADEGTPPMAFLVVLSMTVCTRLSIGWTMKGITPNPRPVTAHFLAVSATPGMVLARPIREKAQILLIRNPGTITEANACHTKVSKAAMATLLLSDPGSWGENMFLVIRTR